jgi:hypothetical protein
LKKLLLASENSEKKLKKYFKNLKIDLLMKEVIFFCKKQNSPWKFDRGKRIQGAQTYAIRA